MISRPIPKSKCLLFLVDPNSQGPPVSKISLKTHSQMLQDWKIMLSKTLLHCPSHR